MAQQNLYPEGSGLGEASTSGLSSRVSDETLERLKRALNNLRDLQLWAILDIGGMKVVDQQLTDLLIVEFLHLRMMLGEDLMNNIRSYHSKILDVSTVLEEDLTSYLGNTVSPAVVQ